MWTETFVIAALVMTRHLARTVEAKLETVVWWWWGLVKKARTKSFK